jgi:hypothetical protein
MRLKAALGRTLPIVHVMMSLTASMATYCSVFFAAITFSIIFSVYSIIANALRFAFNAPARQKESSLMLLKEEMLPWFSNYMIIFTVNYF